MFRALFRSGSLRATAAFALGGAGFTLGSLLLARGLPAREYGLVCLVLGIIAVAGLTAPLGLDQVILRRGLWLERSWRRAALAACLCMAVAAAVVSGILYHLRPGLLVSMTLVIFTLGLAQSGGGYLQGQRRFAPALAVFQVVNLDLALVGLLAVVLGLRTAGAVCALLAGLGIAAAAAIWWWVRPREPAPAAQPSPWSLHREALALVAVQMGGSIFLQLERLLIGPLVGLESLATYGVLAALAASPFRLLQAGVQFTLVPRLRVAADARARRAILAQECYQVFAVVAAGSTAIWLLAPPLARYLLAGRYDLSRELVLAALVAGWLKVFTGFGTAVVVSLGEQRRLRQLSLVCWGTLAVSFAGAWGARSWGLVGVLYGISAGWLVRSLLTAWLARDYLREGRGGDARAAGEVRLRASPR